MHRLVRCKHERRFSRACGADVSLRDVTIKIPDRWYDRGCEWRQAPEAWAEIGEKSVNWVLPREKKVDFRWLAEARSVALRRVRTWFGADGKVSIERWYLSPYVEKPLNSKVIKSFEPELRNRKCFLCFGIPMLSIWALWTLWTFCVPAWICLKRSFFQAAVTSILLYGCTTWTQTKRLEKKLDGTYARMLRAILNKSWRQHPTRHQLYGHLPPITKTIQVRRTIYAGHCWRSRDELISDDGISLLMSKNL